ncbi:hypothetical protein K504DRAFT_538192 [Pleomassaria siparia CBS 279.74]|uniref:Uncharacterized protein n=1 Tax=Pleomassaria siparia CBS 279.74 TaxID=1314801 RepID=A0A6G1JVK5_9PLEO|nr:hypothetical protein K504DRAFT_538192 [Pleomassaria siparia CBS 279.74]
MRRSGGGYRKRILEDSLAIKEPGKGRPPSISRSHSLQTRDLSPHHPPIRTSKSSPSPHSHPHPYPYPHARTHACQPFKPPGLSPTEPSSPAPCALCPIPRLRISNSSSLVNVPDAHLPIAPIPANGIGADYSSRRSASMREPWTDGPASSHCCTACWNWERSH